MWQVYTVVIHAIRVLVVLLSDLRPVSTVRSPGDLRAVSQLRWQVSIGGVTWVACPFIVKRMDTRRVFCLLDIVHICELIVAGDC